MANTLRNWFGTFKLCPIELRERDTANVVYDTVNTGNMFMGIEGVIPDLFLKGPMTKIQVLKAALDHANQHVRNMVYTGIDTRHCYGCEKVAAVVKEVTQKFKNLKVHHAA
jgi:hypothetical protein